jgi:hypothetical protein
MADAASVALSTRGEAVSDGCTLRIFTTPRIGFVPNRHATVNIVGTTNFGFLVRHSSIARLGPSGKETD